MNAHQKGNKFESNVESYSYKTDDIFTKTTTWFESNVESYSYKTTTTVPETSEVV